VTAHQPPAPAEHPAAGAGLPAPGYDALHALAERWETEARLAEAWALHWRAMGDHFLHGAATGRVRQAWDCAKALRNLANDLKEGT
jgi:hypothetical protein